MTSASYDTRFFVEHFYSSDPRVLESTNNEVRHQRDKSISAIVIHEVYRLTLQKEGRDVANLRVNLLTQDFKLIPVSKEIAVASAELRQRYSISMADSIIAATCMNLGAACVSDDPHFRKIKEIRTRWISS